MSSRRFLVYLLCAVTALHLLGCNSGNDGSHAGSGSPSSSDPARLTLHGVAAAAGSPLVGVVLTVTDGQGRSLTSAPTNAAGEYEIAVDAMQPPYFLSAGFVDGDGMPGTLSAVVAAPTAPAAAVAAGRVTANLTPLTALVAQRVLGTALSGSPTADQIAAAAISETRVRQANQEVASALQGALDTLGVPAAQTADLTGSAQQADPQADALANFMQLARITVRRGTIQVGTDAARQSITLAPGAGADNSAAGRSLAPVALASLAALQRGGTTTPIQNVIVVVGENHSFDGLYGAYQPPSGQSVANLLSRGIINADGSPGPNFALAAQRQAQPQSAYVIDPPRMAAYSVLPQPYSTGVWDFAHFRLYPNQPDARFPANLPNGPFPISQYVPYASDNSETGDPVHRFFQMWQQTGGDNAKLDLYTWVAVTAGQGGDTQGITPQNPGQGGEVMGFLNMSRGDAPYFKALAEEFAMSDNFHQSMMGGTGMNFFQIATGDVPYFHVNGVAATPPANQIDDPNPLPGTANFYAHDGDSGGSYVNCADPDQPGVASILAALARAGRKSNCEPGKYYLIGNYGPGFVALTGLPARIAPNVYNYPLQTVPTIAEALSARGVSWRWYSGSREAADVAADAAAFKVPLLLARVAQYNPLGDPLVASANVMNTPALRRNLKGLTSFYNDVAAGTLPAVSFVVPKNLLSGHPGYSAPAAYEQFIADLVARVRSNPQLWAHTAILITTDEGGGYFDSGYIQNLDFFGDGPRIPLLLVSPYARKGHIDHVYHDHASILKFIERNWRLKPLSSRSRDRLPNPVSTADDPYRPRNGPAIGDLMSLFDF